MQDYAHISVQPASRNCGAFISGVDLKAGIDESVAREIHAALMRHQVIFSVTRTLRQSNKPLLQNILVLSVKLVVLHLRREMIAVRFQSS